MVQELKVMTLVLGKEKVVPVIHCDSRDQRVTQNWYSLNDGERAIYVVIPPRWKTGIFIIFSLMSVYAYF